MRNTTRIVQIAIAGLLLTASAAFAADAVQVRARIDKGYITIGDRINFTIDAAVPDGVHIQMPAFRDGLIGEFEIKDRSTRKRGHLFGGITFEYSYSITIYSIGKKEIPAVDVKYKLRGSKDWVVVKTKPLSVEVASVLPRTMPADIKDVKGPLAFFEINWILVASILAILSLLISVMIVCFRIRSRKPVRLPHETALEELEALRARLANHGDVKEYFVGVSDCIRSYIERVFKMRAPEMTSEEFINSLHDSPLLTIQHRELLRGFMDACDMVKFAKYSPKRDEIEKVYSTAKNFVDETKESK